MHLFKAQYELERLDIIHRDVKPSNVALSFDTMTSSQVDETDFLTNFDFSVNEGTYHVKFLDFGLSDKSDENGFGSAEISGTWAYSSPEQLKGGFQTQKSDIWSIGCIFYQLLHGKLLFDGKDRNQVI